MNGQLPPGWTTASLSEIAVINPRHPKTLNDSTVVTFAPMAAVSASSPKFNYLEERLLAEVRQGFTHFAEGDVLFAKITPCMENGKGAVASGLRNGVGCGTTELIVIRPVGGVVSHYIYRFLAQATVRREAKEHFTGTAGQERVPVRFVEELEVPLAPLAEQRRIVAKLETLIQKSAACRDRLTSVVPLLKRFRHSVLVAACSGRLTADWRGFESGAPIVPPVNIGMPEDGECVQTWSWRKLTDLARLESGHTPRKTVPEYWKGGKVPWICLQDIRAAHGSVITDTVLKPTMHGVNNSSARMLPKGTVVFSRDISVGYVSIMGREMATSQHFANWICGAELNNQFLMYALMAARNHLVSSEQGSTVGTIYMPALKEFHVLTPPVAEQEEIVRRVKELLARADQLDMQIAEVQQRIDRLVPSLLARAFRGDLVRTESELARQEGRDYEPASLLVERIRRERIASTKYVLGTSAKRPFRPRAAAARNANLS
jgi:type I restriction enzyme, S subunit